ncbi:hypothetical protein DSO57_1036839 [Entomophthora muscae]|uniref:Uncharacterized protein n=1 Tax=Entomophthora muscae TaxID=34485 RepID=A0ACC2SNJ0_9FUNG|nr:hypothetical protein DSO57_1036839 [Entomophthora muscae]
MSDPKRVYTKLEQSSLRLALGDSSLRFRHPLPANNNFGYRRESRTSLNCSTVASGYIHEAIFQLTGVDILTSDDHFARVASAAPEEQHYQDRSSAVWSLYHTSHHRTQHPSVHTSCSSRRPTARETADQRNADARAAQRLAEARTP